MSGGLGDDRCRRSLEDRKAFEAVDIVFPKLYRGRGAHAGMAQTSSLSSPRPLHMPRKMHLEAPPFLP
jgi:hypothetical protein